MRHTPINSWISARRRTRLSTILPGIWGLWDHWFRPTRIYDVFSAFVELFTLGQRVQALGTEEETGAVAEFYELGNGLYPNPVRTEKIAGPSATLRSILVAPDVLLVKLRFA